MPRGTHVENLVISKPLSLVGEPGASILDGGAAGSVVVIDVEPGAKVALTGLTLRNGASQLGAGIRAGSGVVTVSDCVIRDCSAEAFGGGAIFAAGQLLTVERCELVGNRARQGGALLLDQTVRATIRESRIARNRAREGGAIRLREGAQLELEGVTIAGNESAQPGAIVLSGTMTRKPRLVVRSTKFDQSGPAIVQAGEFPGEVSGLPAVAPQKARRGAR